MSRGEPSATFRDECSTFSIAAYDLTNRDLGVAVQSKYFSVGSVVPWAEAEVGAIATQAVSNPSYGPEGLRLLRQGLSVKDVVETLTRTDRDSENRQVGVVDSKGDSAAHTGSKCIPWAGALTGRNYSIQGNIIESEDVVVAMADAFENVGGELAEKLMASLEAGQSAGGDARGVQSAALLVVRKGRGRAGFGDRYVDLRVEDHINPLEELRRLLNLHFSFSLALESHALIDSNRAKEGVQVALRAVEKYPENDVAHMVLCRAYYKVGEFDLAVEEFRRATSLNAKTPSYVKRMPSWRFIAEDPRFLR